MGTLTLAQMRAQVIKGLGNRSDHTNSELNEVINLSQERITRINQWEELERVFDNTLAITSDARDDKQFELPDDTNTDTAVNIRDAYSFRLITNDGKSKKLVYRTPRAFDELHPEPEYFARNTPAFYTKYANTIEMYPVPDIAYPVRVRATIWPVTLTEVATSQLDHKDDLLISLSLAWMFHLQRNTEESLEWLKTFTAGLRAALKEEGEKPDLDILSHFEAGFKSGSANIGDWWNNPFMREAP